MKTIDKKLKVTIDLLLTKDVPSVFYSFPGEDHTCVVVQTEKIHFIQDIKDLCQRNGFIIAPFESVVSETAYFIRPDLFACTDKGIDHVAEEAKALPDVKKIKDYAENHIASQEEYLETAGYLIDKIKEGEVSKVVLSRVVKETLPKGFNIGEFYIKLRDQYPNAFVYLFNIPDSGLWIGATPETLIRQETDGTVEIMSLAGTVLKPEGDWMIIWGDKERQEQEYVSEYIRIVLSGLGIKDFKEFPPETIFAGHIAHLRTLFRVSPDAAVNMIGELVKRLHPTPAVCGLPKVDAFNFIEKAEVHDRKYYTGFLGPWNLDNKKQLFVNLRCAEINKDKIYLYVGGGLTAGSVPEKEWEETRQKAQTLLSVLHDDQK
jgi:isochorismate synthase